MLDALRASLAEAGYEADILATTGPGDATEAARRSKSADCSALLVVGGDGTVRDVVDGLGPSSPPVLVVPVGTENILAKHLGLAMDVDALAAVLRAGHCTTFDLGLMNGRRFLLVGGIGFDAEVVRRLTVARRGHISYLSYVLPVLRTYATYRHPRLVVHADDDLLFDGRGFAIVGNVPRYALGLSILRDADPGDGLLDVCVFGCTGRLALAGHAMRVLRRRHLGRPDVAYRQARRIRVWSDVETGIELDGDWAGHVPAEFTVEPGAVRFLRPPAGHAGRA